MITLQKSSDVMDVAQNRIPESMNDEKTSLRSTQDLATALSDARDSERQLADLWRRSRELELAENSEETED